MGKLSTHVLDTAQGKPAAGLSFRLFRYQDAAPTLIAQGKTNSDGRADGPLLQGDQVLPGKYRLEFDTATYFKQQGLPLTDPPFLDVVPLEFGIAKPDENYHVPLLLSPWSYSTYRGS